VRFEWRQQSRYEDAIVLRWPRADPPPMKKRVLAGLLWFYVTWFAWAYLAAFFGLPELAGPVLGAAVAMFIAGDPTGRIWGGRSLTRSVAPITDQQSEPA
jgi:hypothetical protein